MLVLAAACSSAPEQSPRSAEFARAAAKEASSTAPLPDLEFEGLIAKAGIRKAFGSRADDIIAQLKRTRAAVVPKKRTLAGLRPDGEPGVQLLAAYESGRPLIIDRQVLSLMPLYLGEMLASSLDLMTRGDRGSGGIEPSTQTSTEEGPTSTTTTGLTSQMQVTVSGSRVQLTVHWTWSMKTVDKVSGKVLVGITDDRRMTGAIDVCPTVAGDVPASLNADVQSVSTTGDGAVTTRRETRASIFTGHVDDQAMLRSVSQEEHDQTSWESTTGGSGSYEYSGSNMNWTGAFDSLNPSGMQLTDKSSGDVAADEVQNSFASGIVLDMATVQPAIKEAQRLWRGGRCVVVMAPDYNAETPVQVEKQNEVQHDEAVEPKSETKFSMRIKHRFAGGVLNQPAQASLTSGDKKIDPTKINAVPASLKYTAPDEQDKKATAQLKSTSKRGIGTLVLAFHTEGKKLKLDIKGTLRISTPTAGLTLVLVADETIGPAVFTKKDDTTWEASAPFHGTLRIEGLPAEICSTLGSETGTAYITATIEKRGDTSVWLVRLGDPSRSSTNLSVACREASFQGLLGSGGYGMQMVYRMGDIRIPIDGGTVPVHTSQAQDISTYKVDAIVTATVSNESK